MERHGVTIVAAVLGLTALVPTAGSSDGGATGSGDAARWFPTSAPAFLHGPATVTRGFPILSREAYEQRAREWISSAGFVPLKVLASERRPLVGLGIDVGWDHENHGYAIYGDPNVGYVVYVDANGDGSLAGERPLELSREGTTYSGVFETSAHDAAAGTYTVRFLFAVYPPGPRSNRTTARVVSWTTRDGTIVIGDRHVPFRLWGVGGIYDHPSYSVWFDLDGDGHGYESETSSERFFVKDGQLNIDGHGYRFVVDRLGRGLSLMPLEHPAPERPSLDLGAPAPPLAARDTAGDDVDLAALHGRVVLLDFSLANCGPCQEDAPTLAQLHRQYHDKGFEIVAIGPDSKTEADEFDRKFHADWPHVCEDDDGPIQKAYRVVAYPSYFLVGRNGRLAAIQLDSSALDGAIEKALAEPATR